MRSASASSTTEPVASRPHMPGYGVVAAHEGRGLLPWSWARERLEKAHNYFLATSRPDGRAHLMPVWGVWLDDRFCFSTGTKSVKARNLRANEYCAVSIEEADHAVIIEGLAKRSSAKRDADFLKRAGEAYSTKYSYKLDPELGPIFIVHPLIAFGFTEFELVDTATRWRFHQPKRAPRRRATGNRSANSRKRR